jgi:hypothetical protein
MIALQKEHEKQVRYVDDQLKAAEKVPFDLIRMRTGLGRLCPLPH